MDKALLDKYSEAKATLMAVTPFVASLLNKARVVITTVVPTAAVDKSNTILINPGFFGSLRPEDRVFVLAHETLHWAFMDTRRDKGNHMVWNVAADAVNNEALLGIMAPSMELRRAMVTLDKIAKITGVDIKMLKTMTKEQIYDLFHIASQAGQQQQGQQGQGQCGGGQSGQGNQQGQQQGQQSQSGQSGQGQQGQQGNQQGQQGQGPGNQGPGIQDGAIGNDLRNTENTPGEVLQEGSRDIYSSKDADVQEAMKRAIAQAEAMQKTRGTMPAGLQRLVDQILRPRVPWKTLLRQALRDGLGKTKTQSWKRLSRRHRDYPGHRRLTVPTVWVGVDTSGSIGPEELSQFLGEIYGIARQSRATVVVVPWDARVYEPIKLTSTSQIRKVARGLRGGGGTDPRPFLKLVQRRMRPLDAVVILSDGYIGSPEGYLTEATAVKRKASVSVFVSTGAEVRWPGWRYMSL